MNDQEPEMIHRADADLAMATPKPEDDLRLLHTEAAEAELAALRAQVERLTAKLALVQRALEKADEGLEYMGLYAPALTEGAAP